VSKTGDKGLSGTTGDAEYLEGDALADALVEIWTRTLSEHSVDRGLDVRLARAWALVESRCNEEGPSLERRPRRPACRKAS
jgi:hypothetical protein